MSAGRVIQRPRATYDLIEQAYYIAEASLDASDRFLRAAEEAFKELAEMPGLGSPRDFGVPALAGLRMWPLPKFEKHLIFYLPVGADPQLPCDLRDRLVTAIMLWQNPSKQITLYSDVGRTTLESSMARNPRTIRLPEPLEQELKREFARRGVKEWSSGIVDLLSEAVRMRRVPGVIFVDGRTGRRPVIAGTGLDVWEVIATWKAVGQDETQLREAYDWLTEPQLRAALNYYALYPEEIEARLAVEESWTPERVRRELPFAALGPVVVEGHE